MNPKNTKPETHHLFPSGEWEGFYTYTQGPGAARHQMSFMLTFAKNKVTGGGGDDIGTFNWKGDYDTESLICQMTKFYHGRHTVFYDGYVDENGIWGMWKMGQWFTGGFHIWPKASKMAAKMKAYAVIPEEELFPKELPKVIEVE